MKVIFVNPDISPSPTNILTKIAFPKWFGDENLGLSSLAGCLKHAGHSVSLVHITRHVTDPIGKSEFTELFAQRLEQGEKMLAAFSSMSLQFQYVEQWSRWIKEEFGVPIICGGVHPTLSPEEVLKCDNIDMVCVGEGEEALVELCDELEKGGDIKNIRNIWVKEGGQIYNNPVRPLVEDLDKLPFPDKTIYNFKELYDSKLFKTAAFSGSRGCPNSCTYCCNHALREIYKDAGKYMRFKSVDYLICEIRDTLEKFPFIEKVLFHDDMFSLGRSRLREFSEKYKQEIGLRFECNCHPKLIDGEIARLLGEAGCEVVRIGIESGNDYIRTKILNRDVTREKTIESCRLLRNEGITVYPYNMVGLPFEDAQAILDTVKLNAEVEADITLPTIFYPFEKTKIHEMCEKEGFLSDRTVTSIFKGSVLSLPSLSSRQITEFRRLFKHLVKIYSLVNKLPGSFSRAIIFVLDKVLGNRISFWLIACFLDLIRILLIPVRLTVAVFSRR